jgi:hypothetical protein
MARVTIRVGGPEPVVATIIKATPVGLLGTEGIVSIGQLFITGQPAALRALADACEEAAAMAVEYDADPDAFNHREQAERDRDA